MAFSLLVFWANDFGIPKSIRNVRKHAVCLALAAEEAEERAVAGVVVPAARQWVIIAANRGGRGRLDALAAFSCLLEEESSAISPPRANTRDWKC